MFDLLGEKHQAGLSYLELGRLSAAAGAASRAAAYLKDAARIFESLGAEPDLAEVRTALEAVPRHRVCRTRRLHDGWRRRDRQAPRGRRGDACPARARSRDGTHRGVRRHRRRNLRAAVVGSAASRSVGRAVTPIPRAAWQARSRSRRVVRRPVSPSRRSDVRRTGHAPRSSRFRERSARGPCAGCGRSALFCVRDSTCAARGNVRSRWPAVPPIGSSSRCCQASYAPARRCIG